MAAPSPWLHLWSRPVTSPDGMLRSPAAATRSFDTQNISDLRLEVSLGRNNPTVQRIPARLTRIATAQAVRPSLPPVRQDRDFARREEFDLANQAVAPVMASFPARPAPDLVAPHAQRILIFQRLDGRVPAI